jgi:hypothetical protein
MFATSDEAIAAAEDPAEDDRICRDSVVWETKPQPTYRGILRVSQPLTSGRCMERREELIAATVDTYGLHSDNAGKSRRVGFKQRVGVGRGMGSACGRARWRFPPQ